MSGTEDQGLAAIIGAGLVAVGHGIAKALRTKRRSTPPAIPAIPPPPSAEHSATSARIGALAQRLDQLEKEQTIMRHETAQKLEDLHDSIDELSKASAATSAILPRVEKQLAELREDLREDRKRAPTNRD